MKKTLFILLILVLVTPAQHAQDYSNWNTRGYFRTATGERIKEYLKAGVDLNVRDQDGAIPLHWAAKENENPEVIAMLLKWGADPNAQTDYGETPLHWAAKENENPKVIAMLLKWGADPNVRSDYGGAVPLHWAAKENENPEVIAVLLKWGAYPNVSTKNGETPWNFIQQNEALKGTEIYWKLKNLQY